jgi:hypothetical protein
MGVRLSPELRSGGTPMTPIASMYLLPTGELSSFLAISKTVLIGAPRISRGRGAASGRGEVDRCQTPARNHSASRACAVPRPATPIPGPFLEPTGHPESSAPRLKLTAWWNLCLQPK